MLKTKELFELPIYRLKEDEYNESLREHIKKNSPMSAEYSRKDYGGDWQYNEIIGFLRFYVSGKSQIRCEYWQTDAKRKVRTPKKQFIMTSDSYCTQNFNPSASNDDLKATIQSCIDHCKVNLGGKWHVDERLFRETFDYINWSSLLA
jgi:hypothetical protein